MYYPNLKTSDSELRAIRFLDDATKRYITPIFELTRSRRTKKRPAGSIHRRMEQLIDVYGNNSFILDLSTEEDLMNEETIHLFDDSKGYSKWRNFLEASAGNYVIPCLLYVEDGSKANFQEQARQLVDRYGRVCLRTSVADQEAAKLYSWAAEVVDPNNLIVCAILYYIEPRRMENYVSLCRAYITSVIGNRIPEVLIFPGSSFPRYVTDREGSGDAEGEFRALEIAVESDLMGKFPNLPIQPSDFASVHPIRYPTGGGNWIPRIDIFDGSNFNYVRARRDDGGYDSAAREINSGLISKLPDCWGKAQIANTIAGNVAGGSPSFWISVRINCWITQRAAQR